MAALGGVEHLDVSGDIGKSILSSELNLATNPLALDQLEEAFVHGVVMAVDPPPQDAEQIVIQAETLLS